MVIEEAVERLTEIMDHCPGALVCGSETEGEFEIPCLRQEEIISGGLATFNVVEHASAAESPVAISTETDGANDSKDESLRASAPERQAEPDVASDSNDESFDIQSVPSLAASDNPPDDVASRTSLATDGVKSSDQEPVHIHSTPLRFEPEARSRKSPKPQQAKDLQPKGNLLVDASESDSESDEQLWFRQSRTAGRILNPKPMEKATFKSRVADFVFHSESDSDPEIRPQNKSDWIDQGSKEKDIVVGSRGHAEVHRSGDDAWELVEAKLVDADAMEPNTLECWLEV
jgi:hypothetical protein